MQAIRIAAVPALEFGAHGPFSPGGVASQSMGSARLRRAMNLVRATVVLRGGGDMYRCAPGACGCPGLQVTVLSSHPHLSR